MRRPDDEANRRQGTAGRRATRSTRLIASGAVLGACAALLFATLLGGLGSGLFVASGDQGTDAALEPLRAPVHSCLMWKRADALDARQVDCAEPHLFEVTGTVELADLDGAAPFPDPQRWQELVAERCGQRTTEALAGRFDPFGRYTVGAIKPSEDGWQRGDRTLRCGVQSSGRTGALFATTGPVLTQDQSDVHVPGTCLANDAKAVGDPVDCAAAHAVEIVGVVDLSAAFPGGFPPEPAQDGVLDAECTRLAAEFAGGPSVVKDKGLTLFWETLRPESWDAGSKRVDCRLGAFLPDRSGFAPVTGGVQGAVQVGRDPAPPAEPAPGPSPITVPAVTEAARPGPPPPPS